MGSRWGPQEYRGRRGGSIHVGRREGGLGDRGGITERGEMAGQLGKTGLDAQGRSRPLRIYRIKAVGKGPLAEAEMTCRGLCLMVSGEVGQTLQRLRARESVVTRNSPWTC